MRTTTTVLGLLLLACLLAVSPALAQSKEQQIAMTREEIAEAENAVREAEAVGAPIYAKDLYDEAVSRLGAARERAEDKRSAVRTEARLRAVEAQLAAEAAKARARYILAVTETRDLRADVARFGGTLAPMTIPQEPPLMLERGMTSLERVEYAERVVAEAKQAGAMQVAPEDLKRADEILETARRIAKNTKQSDSADHLAYTAEMWARRALYEAKMRDYSAVLPGLRLERSRLAQAVKEREILEERRQREEAERRAADLRAALEAEQASRRTREEEVRRLQQTLRQAEMAMSSQLDADRQARIDAERRLDQLARAYEAALTRQVEPAEAARLRRELDDQRRELELMQERERMSEESMLREIDRLEQQLQMERERGNVSAQVLAQRQQELQSRSDELERLRSERQMAERQREEAEEAFRARIAEAESRRAAAERETAELRAQLETERQRAAQAASELERTREEMRQREQAERERMQRIEQSIAQIAETRRDERGFVITLPGVFFPTGKATLNPNARATLKRIAEQVNLDPSMKITVEGHTDSVGGDEMNQKLSEQRADSVKEYLVSQGVNPNRVSTMGKGESDPIATNDTSAGRQQNRRVELVLVEQGD